MKIQLIPGTILCTLLFINVILNAQNRQVPHEIKVDLQKETGDMNPMWAYFGYDEPNFTYTADGKKLINDLSKLSPVPVYYRAHSLLNTDEGPRMALKWGSTNAYTEDKNGEPVYNWEIIDKIFDTYIESGGKPYVEIGFMPKALSSKPEPYRHNWDPDPNSTAPYSNNIHTGIHYPPNDYEKWAELIYQWVQHSVERYGAEEVASWWWDVWNEPGWNWWMGTKEEYFKLYDYSVDAVKRALPEARVGGPTVANPDSLTHINAEYLRDFLEHCRSGKNYATGKTGSPLDYITFHIKGRPRVINHGEYVQMNMSRQLNGLKTGFEIISSFPEFKDLPVILGEADPEGCAACAMEFHPQNTYRNGTMYSSYTAASFARFYELADQYDIHLEGAVSWSFIFHDQPYFAGFRSMATNGINKPVLNIFRMFGMMKGKRVFVESNSSMNVNDIIKNHVRGEVSDINALAAKEKNKVSIMIWNYHDNHLDAPPSPVRLKIDHVPSDKVLIHHYRVDKKHSNSYTEWQEMGTPQQLTDGQYEKLEESGDLELWKSPEWKNIDNSTLILNYELPRHGVSFITLEW